MTSKNLCFKLMLEDLKRRVWVIALTMLAMMFSILVPVAIKCSEYADLVHGWDADQIRRRTVNIVDLLGVNGFAICALTAAAVLWAVSGFQYLHNSKKVDFYHSIPVKRHVIYLANLLNGILVPAILYLLFLVPSVILAYRTIDPTAIGMIPWKIFTVNMVYYSLLYVVTVIAMMLTGNVVIALLGTGVFCGYVPAILFLIRGYFSMWFHSYYETAESLQRFNQILRYSSPVSSYVYVLQDFWDKKPILGMTAGAAVVTVLLAVAAYLLYRVRASEAAGKAMAFQKTKMPIKVLIVIPTALTSGMLFYELRDTLAWLLFGTVCGVIIVHCMMEIIYHFDFRKLFTNKLHLAGCMVVTLLLAIAGYCDWYGYDSWLPDANKLEDAAVHLGYEDQWVTYGAPGEPNENSDYIYWEYENSVEYKLNRMHVTDLYSVLELAKQGIERGVHLVQEEENTGLEWKQVIFQYRMKNGKTATRKYSVPLCEETWEFFDALHDSIEYKTGAYPILTQTAADTVGVYYQQYNQITELDLKKEEIAAFLDVYQKEWEKLTLDTRRKELPIATIQFRTAQMQDAIDYNGRLKRYGNGISDRCYYPIYPSFTHTLKLLNDQGIEVQELDETSLSVIQIHYRDAYWAEENEGRLTGLEGTYRSLREDDELKVFGKALVYHDYYDMNPFYILDQFENADVSASFRNDGNNGVDEVYRGFYLDANNLPSEVAEEYQLVNLAQEEAVAKTDYAVTEAVEVMPER